MKNAFKFMTLSILTVFFVSAQAQAENVQGSIVSIDRNNNTVTIDPEGTGSFPGGEVGGGNLIFHLGQGTQFSQGVSSLNDLEVGDQISLQANRQGVNGNWQVQTLATTSTTENLGTDALNQNAAGMQAGMRNRSISQADINAGALGTNNAPIPGNNLDPNRNRSLPLTQADLNAGAGTQNTNNFSAGANQGLANRDTSLNGTAGTNNSGSATASTSGSTSASSSGSTR